MENVLERIAVLFAKRKADAVNEGHFARSSPSCSRRQSHWSARRRGEATTRGARATCRSRRSSGECWRSAAEPDGGSAAPAGGALDAVEEAQHARLSGGSGVLRARVRLARGGPMAPTHSHYPGAADEVRGLSPLDADARVPGAHARGVPGEGGGRRRRAAAHVSRARRAAYRLASALRRVGVRKGDRVAVLSPNSTELLEAHFGVPQIGAVLVAINVRLSPGEVSAILRHSGARVLLVDHALAADLDRGATGASHLVFTGRGGDREPGWGEIGYERFLATPARRSRSRRTWTTRTRRSASTTRVARRASRRASCTRTAAHT